ncbi:GNAT family N-acetyltransferase [Loktanella sp. IMCC34160]|uniref:GNAT family N-acetyltransferase n=1 Tax=Loktanella sp. IMCC34160 TaxID=2510646 RepID=UPI00101D0B33|nr:GNAT family N-acetyltransferase [Loktanella sp. IMCC34160]RYG89486.1 GNAT family N-acetyltransferase [Loktanella sp. IMCC34160]
MEIRRAKMTDAAALTDVVRAAYAPFREAGLNLPDVEAGIDDAIVETPVWLAVEQDVILGGVIVRQSDTMIQVENLAVHPGASGRGVGKGLLQTVEDWAREQGARGLQLATHADMAGTVAFYRRLGWREVGREGAKLYLAKILTENEP